MDLFDASISTLQTAMDLRMSQQRITAANIANVDTGGYTAQKMDFEASMAAAMEGGSPVPVVYDSDAPAVGLDGNNVNVESELSDLSRNKLMYSVTSQLLAAKFRQLAAITENSQ